MIFKLPFEDLIYFLMQQNMYSISEILWKSYVVNTKLTYINAQIWLSVVVNAVEAPPPHPFIREMLSSWL